MNQPVGGAGLLSGSEEADQGVRCGRGRPPHILVVAAGIRVHNSGIVFRFWGVVIPWLVAALVWGDPVAQHEVAPEVLLLARIKTKMAENLARQPNYTCLQTIERSRRRAPSQRYQLVDTLQLEVALVEGKEMLAWPGAGQFEERELREVVPTGAISSGGFALTTRAVFLSHQPVFAYAGEEECDGRRCVRYDFQVGSLSSGYSLRVGSATAIVPYHGSFWADPETLDLLRLETHADDIPPDLRLESSGEQLEYARVRIGESSFLLPRKVVMTMVGLDGSASRNETRFSDCREYVGESFISFGEPPPDEPAPAPAPPTVMELPGGLRLDLALETPISDTDSPVGEPITAVLRSDAKRNKKIIVPKGAVATGRLLHLQRVTGKVDYCVVALRFESLEFDHQRADLLAELESFPSVSFFGSHPTMTPDYPGGAIVDTTELERLPGVGVFYMKGASLRLNRGLRMIWRTKTKQDRQRE